MMRSRWTIGLTALCLLSSAALLPAAEDLALDLPEGVSTSPTALNAVQEEAVMTFVKSWTQKLNSDNPIETARARERLMEPLRGQATPTFKSVFAAALGPALAQPSQSPNLLVRLNSMIVASTSADPSLVPIALRGLQDNDPAIRYWAGKSIARLGESGKLSPEDEAKLLGELAPLIRKEGNRLVLHQLLRGLSKLTIADARMQLLQALNDRVNMHVHDVNLTPLPETEALEALFSGLAYEMGGSKGTTPGNKQIIRQATMVMYRYMLSSARVLVSNPPQDNDLRHEYENVLSIGDKWMPWAFEKLTDKKRDEFPALTSRILNRQWADSLQTVQNDMAKALIAPPISLKPEELKVD